MPLRDFPGSYLLPAEVATFTKSFIPIIKKAPESATLIHKTADELIADLLKAEKNSAMKTASQFTKLLEDYDGARDESYRKGKDLIYGLCGRKNPAKAAAAQRIYQSLVKHNLNLAREPYAIESHYLNALKEELKKPENQADIELIDVKEEIDDIFEKQSAFEGLFNQKNEANSQSTSAQLSILVQPLREKIGELEGVINTEERHAPEAFKAIVDEVNQLIASTITIAKARKTRNANTTNNDKKNDTGAV
jgi:hypothetical protein